MALSDGTNCGFVTARPTADPDGAATFVTDNASLAGKFTTPAGAVAITEIGWYTGDATEAANFDVGIYEADGVDGMASTLKASTRNQAKGTGAGWKYAALSCAVTAETTYWLAVQIDNTTTQTKIDYDSLAGRLFSYMSAETALAETWASDGTAAAWPAIYAVYTTGSGAAIKVAAAMRMRR